MKTTPRQLILSLATAAFACISYGNASEEQTDWSEFQAPVSEDAYVLETVAPHYPEAMRMRGQQGKTLLKLRVSESGDVTGINVVATTNDAFAQAAIESVQNWYFEPGKREGAPVQQYVLVPVTFEIEGLAKVSYASM